MNVFEANELLEQIGELEKKIKAAELERDGFIEIYQARIAQAQAQCEEKISQEKSLLNELTETLRRYASANLPENKKTIALPAGKLSFKKTQPKFYFDDKEISAANERLISYCKVNAPEFVKQKVIETADWAEFKKRLMIFEGKAFFKETGELVEGMQVQEFPDKFSITTN